LLLKVEFGARIRCGSTLPASGRHAVRQLAGETILDGVFSAGCFCSHLFAAYLPARRSTATFAGLILLAARPAPRLFVWTGLTKGDPLFHLSQVALKRHDHGVRVRNRSCAAARHFEASWCRGRRC